MNELRERVWQAIWATRFSRSLTVPTDAVLAALGLDDLDAAVERAQTAWQNNLDGAPHEAMRDALEAALTPPKKP